MTHRLDQRLIWIGVVAALMLSACAGPRSVGKAARPDGATAAVAKSGRPGVKVGGPYEINGTWYYPHEQPDYDETGIASWYGPNFHGQPTANGDTYDMDGLTAAHQTLPLPTRVRVTNLENGKSVVLEVNDRGPFVRNRIIDVSRRAARLLGFEKKGTAKVRVQAIGQVGETFVSDKPVTTDEERTLIEAAPRTSIQVAALPPPPGVTSAPPIQVQQLPSPSSEASDDAWQPPPIEEVPTGKVTIVPVAPTGIFVQAGAFTDFGNANRLRARLSPYGNAEISQIVINNIDYFRVRLGPVSTVEEADRLLSQVIGAGVREARIVVD